MLSFRTRILLIVLALGIVPPALLGLWLTRSTASSGEEIVRARVDASVEDATRELVSRWIGLRSRILDLADDASIRSMLDGAGTRTPGGLDAAVSRLGFRPLRLELRDLDDRVVWRAPEPDAGSFRPPGLGLEFPVHDGQSARRLGTLAVEIGGSTLLPGERAPEGVLVGLFHGTTGLSLLPRPFDRALAQGDPVVWSGEEWLVSRYALDEPPVTLAVAAPANPFGDLFARKARTGLWLLLGVSAAAFALAFVVTSRLTRSLGTLSEAARAVADGDLDRQVEVEGPVEVGEVAGTFNTMIRSLRRTLDELSTRESLAAVGEFAASLAHEVRNPLAAIRVDLERVEEGLPEASPLRRPQARALREIVRLDETVGRALRSARTGTFRPSVLDLREPIRAAWHAAKPELERRRASLDLVGASDPVEVRGDASALEQLFLNLLRNAAQALDEGGSVAVRIGSGEGRVVVEVVDDGCGVRAEDLGRVFDPMYSTRVDGTGLGLTVARRIAVAHGGRLHFDSVEGKGSMVRVELPAPRGGDA